MASKSRRAKSRRRVRYRQSSARLAAKGRRALKDKAMRDERAGLVRPSERSEP